MSHLSYSQFRTFDDCPRKYFHVYAAPEGRRRPLPTDAMLAGSERHAAIAADIEHAYYDALPSGWGERVKERVAAGWTVSVELALELATPYAPIKCVIDLLLISPDRSRCEIIDWKGNRLPDDDAQLQVYAAAVAAQHPEIQDFACAYVLTERTGWKRYNYEAADVAAFYKAIRKRAYEMRGLGPEIDQYPRRPSKKCAECPFAIECIGDMHALPFAEMSIEQVIETAYLAAAIESQCDEIVRAHLKRTGEDSVYVNGQGYTLSYTETMRKSKQKAKKGEHS